jgi:hypothetical protein
MAVFSGLEPTIVKPLKGFLGLALKVGSVSDRFQVLILNLVCFKMLLGAFLGI